MGGLALAIQHGLNCGHTETITAILVVPSHVFSAQSWLESHEVFFLRIPFLQRNFREGIKTGHFTVRPTARGEGSAPPAQTVSKCENVDPFFSLFDSLIL